MHLCAGPTGLHHDNVVAGSTLTLCFDGATDGKEKLLAVSAITAGRNQTINPGVSAEGMPQGVLRTVVGAFRLKPDLEQGLTTGSAAMAAQCINGIIQRMDLPAGAEVMLQCDSCTTNGAVCTRVGEEVLAMELEGACRGRDAEGDNGDEQAQRVTQVHCYLHILNNTIYHMVLAMSGKSDTNDRNSGNTAYGIKLEAMCKLFNVHAKDIAWPDFFPVTNDTRFGSYCSVPVAVLQHHRRMAGTCRKYLALPKAHQQAAIAKLVSKVATYGI